MTSLQAALPAPYYVDAAHWAREREQVLHREWFCAGRRARPRRRPPALAVVDVAGESILVTRDGDGRLRAFFNVCRHRGSQVVPVDPDVEPPAPCRGAVAALPVPLVDLRPRRPAAARAAHRGRRRLRPRRASACTRSASTPGAASSSCTSRRRPARLRCAIRSARPSSEWRATRSTASSSATVGSTTSAANYKVVLENYNECYHCAGVHPELVRLVPAFGRGGSRPRLGGRHPAPGRCLDLHSVGHLRPGAVPRAGRRREGAAQGRAALPEPHAQPVRRPRGGVHALADRRRPDPDRVRPAVRAG